MGNGGRDRLGFSGHYGRGLFPKKHVNRQRNGDNPDTLSRGKNLGDNPPAGIITKKFNDEAGRGVEE